MAKTKTKLLTKFINGVKAQTVDNVSSGSLVDIVVIAIRGIGRVFKSLEVILNESFGRSE